MTFFTIKMNSLRGGGGVLPIGTGKAYSYVAMYPGPPFNFARGGSGSRKYVI